MEKAAKILLLLTVFFTPLIYDWFNFGYEQAKVIFFILLTSLTFIFWILGKPKLKWDLIKTFSLIFILALLLTSITGLNLNNSLWGTEPYYQGWLTYFCLFIFSLMVSSLKIPLKYYALALTASALVVSSVALEDWVLKNLLGYNVINYAGRVVSTFGQPNFYSGFLLLTLPFSYYLFRNYKGKLGGLGRLGGVISVLGIIVSDSRSAILLMMILLILMLVNQFKFKYLIGVFIYSLIIFSAVFGLYFSSGIVNKEISKPLATVNPDLTRESVEQRAYIWPAALQVINEKPIMGQGLENISLSYSNYFKNNFYDLFEANQKVSPVLLSLKELNIDRTHNYFLDLMLFSGILGTLAWIFLIMVLFIKLFQKHDDRPSFEIMVCLITYLIWIQFQNQSVVNLIYFWLLAGLIDSSSFQL